MPSHTAPLSDGLARVRERLLDSEGLVRAVASGRQRGAAPRWRRAEFRYVDLKAGRHLQVTAYDETQAHTGNHAEGDAAAAAADQWLEEPFGNWHVETTTEVLQLRVTKKGDAQVSIAQRPPIEPHRAHDRAKPRLLDAGDEVLRALGIADEQGRIKPSRQAKYRQVEELLRLLGPTITEAIETGRLREPTPDDPLRVVDLGCGNAYLTFAAHRFLESGLGLPVTLTGVDVKQQAHDRNTALAGRLGLDARFVVGTIADAAVDPAPEVVLALHACDTASDEALARAVRWRAPVVLAAPCCHHDLAAQLRRAPTPPPFGSLTRHGILRERLADTLTDALRASLLRLSGYRVDVVEFVGSEHTPRNTLIRAVRTDAAADAAVRTDYEQLVAQWQVQPRLAELLAEAVVGPDA